MVIGKLKTSELKGHNQLYLRRRQSGKLFYNKTETIQNILLNSKYEYLEFFSIILNLQLFKFRIAVAIHSKIQLTSL